MKLQKLHIKNFKSIVDLEIVEPNPFTVFVGPNGSGKSNVFEALEFLLGESAAKVRLFGGIENLKHRNTESDTYYFRLDSEASSLEEKISYYDDTFPISLLVAAGTNSKVLTGESLASYGEYFDSRRKFNFLRLFVNNVSKQKINYGDDMKLNFSASNLEKVLKRILQDEVKREEIKEWLDLFIPGFENIEIVSSELSGTDTLVMYEKGIKKPFTKDLLSDGTYNILALLTAVYQSDEPQFLCIEEPENGLNPYVVRALAEFFRLMCADKGHYIWLNTHSQSLVSELREEEMILVDKIEGETKIRQFKKGDFYGLRADEAWLTNALGGGLPW